MNDPETPLEQEKTHMKKVKKNVHKTQKKVAPKKSLVKVITNTPFILISLLVIILVFMVAVNIDRILPIFKPGPAKDVVAIVNGQEITAAELEKEYQAVPVQIQIMMDKKTFLEESLIPQRLLEKEAEKSDVSEAEIDGYIAFYLSQINKTRDEVVLLLQQQGRTEQDFRDQIKLSLFVNKSIGEKIKVSDDEVSTFYDENKQLLPLVDNATPPLEDVKEQIRAYLTSQKQAEELKAWIAELKRNAQVEILLQDANETEEKKFATFQDTGEEICKNADGKPIVRVFSTTTCPHCKWIKGTVDSVLKDYAQDIDAKHYEVDIKDDLLTGEKEDTVPLEELQLLSKYSQGGVPTFVFGCKYVRIGNGYEKENDLAAEEKEFRSVLNDLIA